jgi:ATP-dependent DNA helicase RecQ
MEKLLKKYFGFDNFRPMQKQIIDEILKKRDVFVLMPTGGGKSLCYQLPALKLKGLTLVVSPLIALMKDQVDSLKANGIGAEFINSSLSFDEIKTIENKILTGKVKILFVAPERFNSNYFFNFLYGIKLSLIAIDEAHCISEWGHDFRPHYRNLKILKKRFKYTPFIALTATATGEVRRDIQKQLALNRAKVFVSSFNRENLNLMIYPKRRAFNQVVDLIKKHENESVIIYCFSRRETEEIAGSLKNMGIKAESYHAGLESKKRQKVQERFIRDKTEVMVATIAFGMGIDKPNVRLVIHYSFPKTLESYYQEVGRAGRDGLKSDCVLFYSYGDKRKHEFFIEQMQDEKQKTIAREKLNQVIEYAETTICRKKYLMEYFGDSLEGDNCGSCDLCLSERDSFDATEIVQKILSAVIKTGNMFGRSYVVDVMRGSRKKQILSNGHTNLSVFAIAKDHSKDDLDYFFNALLEEGLIVKENTKFSTIKISNKGINFLKNKETINLFKPQKQRVSVKKEKIVDYDEILFLRLKALRSTIAKEENVPNFVIFGDVALREMAYYFPVNQENFAKITGVGEKKLEDYGERFMALIKGHVKRFRLTPKEIGKGALAKRKTEKPKVNSLFSARYRVTKEMIKKEKSIKEIAEKQNLKFETILNHIEKLLQNGEKLEIDYLKKNLKNYSKIEKAFLNSKDRKLKPVYEALNGGADYDEIKLSRVLVFRGD